jgi:SNF2 family DNA or RNA helicase
LVDGDKVRNVPQITFPIRALPNLARAIPNWWKVSSEDAIKATMEISNSIKQRKQWIVEIRNEYNGEVKFYGGYEPKGIYPPLKHQIVMFNAIARLGGAAILAEPGTCKTGAYVWGIDYRIKSGHVKKALVITLSHLKENVLKEMSIQAPGLSGVVLDNKIQSDKIINKTYKVAKKNMDYDVYIANYESMNSLSDIIPDDYFQMVILDEAHRIGSPRSNQTKAIVEKFEYVQYKYIITGTLNANNPMSFFMPFRFMGPEMVNEANFYEFRQKHFYTVDPDQHIWVPSPGTHQHVQKLIGNASVCFKKEDCLDLPPKVYETLKCDMSPAQLEEYKRTRDDMMFIIKKGCQDCDKNGTKCDWVCNNAILVKNILVKITKLAQITCGFFIETKFEITPEGKKVDKSVVHWFDENPKLNLLVSTINDIPNDRKVIIWSHYTAGVKLIADRIKKAFGPDSYVTVFGDDNAFDKVNQFRDNPKIRFFIANQKKAGTGLNIQFSNYQVFFSNDYSYVRRQQAEDRQHRQGQKDTVTIFDLACQKSIDEEILNIVLVEKKELDASLNSLARIGGL